MLLQLHPVLERWFWSKHKKCERIMHLTSRACAFWEENCPCAIMSAEYSLLLWLARSSKSLAHLVQPFLATSLTPSVDQSVDGVSFACSRMLAAVLVKILFDCVCVESKDACGILSWTFPPILYYWKYLPEQRCQFYFLSESRSTFKNPAKIF